MVVGLIRPDEGKYFLNDKNITKLPMYKRAQMGLDIYRRKHRFQELSVEDNITAVLEMTKLTKKAAKRKTGNID